MFDEMKVNDKDFKVSQNLVTADDIACNKTLDSYLGSKTQPCLATDQVKANIARNASNFFQETSNLKCFKDTKLFVTKFEKADDEPLRNYEIELRESSDQLDNVCLLNNSDNQNNNEDCQTNSSFDFYN